MKLDYFGFVFHDAAVHESVMQHRAFLPGNSDNIVAQEIRRTANRIERYWDRPIHGSAARIFAHAQRSYQERQSAREE